MSTNKDTPSLIEDLKKQASEIAAKLAEATQVQLEALHLKLKDAHLEVQRITEEIKKHGGELEAPKRRGRNPGSRNKTKLTSLPAKRGPNARRAKRGAVSSAIASYVTKAGKKGAHVKDISAATGIKPANVTAFFYSPKGKKEFKNLGKATFAAK
jgi:hypothetical protein